MWPSSGCGLDPPVVVEAIIHDNPKTSLAGSGCPSGSGTPRAVAGVGEFVVTGDVSQYTKADFLQPGKHTEMLARFSSVATESGGADTQGDPAVLG